MTYVYRIKHIPTGLYFRTCGSYHKTSLDIAGQLYSTEKCISHAMLHGKDDYNWITIRSTFKYYNKFKQLYEYNDYEIKVKTRGNNKDIKYSKFKIPKSEFEAEIFKTIEND